MAGSISSLWPLSWIRPQLSERSQAEIGDVQPPVEGMGRNLSLERLMNCALNSVVVKDMCNSSLLYHRKPTSLTQLINALLLHHKRKAIIMEDFKLNPRFVTESPWLSHNF